MRKYIFAVVLGVAVLSGCATSPLSPYGVIPEHSNNLVANSSNFKEGKTTYDEVVAVIGKPSNQGIGSDGGRIANYQDCYKYDGKGVCQQVQMIFNKQGILVHKLSF